MWIASHRFLSLLLGVGLKWFYPHHTHVSERGIRLHNFLRIDNSSWSVNSSTLFDVAGMSWCQRKYHVLYIIRQPIINSIY